jgi:anti-sigma B factor antagonist
MVLQFENAAGVLVARLMGEELGADTSDDVRRSLLGEISRNPWVLLDLSSLTFMDSSGLGVLVSALKAVREHGELRLIGVDPRVLDLLNLTGLRRVFTIDGSEATAVAALRSARNRALAA